MTARKLRLNTRFAIASLVVATSALPFLLGRIEALWVALIPVGAWLLGSWWIIHSASASMRKREPVPVLALIAIPMSLALTSCVAAFIESLLLYKILGHH